MRRLPLLLAAFAFPLLSSAPASAHGDVPAGQLPFVEAGAFVGGGVNFGLLDDVDGQLFWTCEEAHEQSVRWWHRQAGGRVLIGTFRGLWATDDGGCTWTEHAPELSGKHLAAIALDPDDPTRIVLATATAGEANAVWRSEDDGDTWTQLGFSAAETNVYSIAAGPGGQTIWISTLDLVAQTTGLLRSEDGGASFLPVEADLVDYVSPRLQGLSTDGGTVYLTARVGFVDYALLSSSDGLRTVDEVELFNGELFSAAEFRGALYAIIDNARLMRSEDGESWSEIENGPSRCVRRIGDQLWGCGQFTDASYFFVSEDGLSFTPAFDPAEVLPRPCAEGGPSLECGLAWAELNESYGLGPAPADDSDSCGSSGGCSGSAAAALLPLVLAPGLRRRSATS